MINSKSIYEKINKCFESDAFPTPGILRSELKHSDENVVYSNVCILLFICIMKTRQWNS